MAIYHLSMQIISRSKGQSAVAAAAYRSGEKLIDERTGETKFYKRNVQPDTMILAPVNSPSWVTDREKLWNEVEKMEKRKDSQLAREMNIALPRELSKNQQKGLIRSFVQEQFVDKGMIADIAIHRDDVNNPHAHIMLTMRTIDEKGFGKKNRDWNADFANSKKNEKGFIKSSENCLDIREKWAEHANQALEREGIQDRISHLSHEARGLEILPTVHLGHVAHEMEKHGVESDRGTINREREEYNRIVVDLQTYREEKKALEQELARKQEQKQKAESFHTPSERVHLQEASKLLKTEPTLQNIAERHEQIDKWEKRINNQDQYLRWKDEKIKEALDHYRWIHAFNNQIQQAQQQMEKMNWLNPLKIKENRAMKERAEQTMIQAKNKIAFHDETLNYHREKLGFTTEKELHQLKQHHEIDRPGLLEKNRNQRQHIHRERDVLQKAENALKNAFVRQVASLYPERPEMRCMSLETAQKLIELNKLNGNQVVPLQTIEKTLDNRRADIQRLQGELTRIDRNRVTLAACSRVLTALRETSCHR